MAMCIIRTAKISTAGGIGASLDHGYRQKETLNADKLKEHENSHDIASRDMAYKAITKLVPNDRRKNAVICIEYLVTASPEFFKSSSREKQDKYFEEAKSWLEDKHGKQNVVTTSIHRDETSPHLIAYVVPLKWNEKQQKDTLNARDFLGGRQKLTAMQTDFAKNVGSHFGLSRGIERSNAKHIKVKEFYSEIQKPVSNTHKIGLEINVPRPKLLESKEKYGNRVAESVFSQAMKAVQHDIVKAKFSDYEKLSKELEKSKSITTNQARHIEKMHEKILGYYGLDENRQKKVDAFISGLKMEQTVEKKEMTQDIKHKQSRGLSM